MLIPSDSKKGSDTDYSIRLEKIQLMVIALLFDWRKVQIMAIEILWHWKNVMALKKS